MFGYSDTEDDTPENTPDSQAYIEGQPSAERQSNIKGQAHTEEKSRHTREPKDLSHFTDDLKTRLTYVYQEHRLKIYVVAALIALVLGYLLFFGQESKNTAAVDELLPFSNTEVPGLGVVSATPPKTLSKTPPKTLKAHIAGAVQNPGVYSLAEGERVQDLLLAAGGAQSEASLGEINLAAPLQDGEKVCVPWLDSEKNALCEKDENQGGVSGSGSSSGGGGLININTASVEELQELPGVGPAIARRILLLRENLGGFESVDDLLQVSGLGESAIEELRGLVAT